MKLLSYSPMCASEMHSQGVMLIIPEQTAGRLHKSGNIIERELDPEVHL